MHIFMYIIYIYIYILYILFIVPIQHVKITISDNYATSGDIASGQSGDGTITIGAYEQSGDDIIIVDDEVMLDCTVTAVRGISAPVDIIWTTGGKVVKRVHDIMADMKNDYAIYIDSFKISKIDNGREYNCTGVINASRPIYSSDKITLIFTGKYSYHT